MVQLGKSFEALGELQPGDVIEFNAALDDEDGRLKRPTKIAVSGSGRGEAQLTSCSS